MYKVRKRNGKVVNFEITKISNAMKKAFEASRRETAAGAFAYTEY